MKDLSIFSFDLSDKTTGSVLSMYNIEHLSDGRRNICEKWFYFGDQDDCRKIYEKHFFKIFYSRTKTLKTSIRGLGLFKDVKKMILRLAFDFLSSH